YNNSKDTDDDLTWYIIWSNDKSECYYASSSTKINDYKDLTFEKSSTKPLPVKETEIKEEEVVEVTEEEFAPEIEADFETGDGFSESETDVDSDAGDSDGDGGE
ncbi:MAG: hypothetical protein ABIP51_00025, partial [Bacteroidia bacterium]